MVKFGYVKVTEDRTSEEIDRVTFIKGPGIIIKLSTNCYPRVIISHSALSLNKTHDVYE